jgi:hypothetical protein
VPVKAAPKVEPKVAPKPAQKKKGAFDDSDDDEDDFTFQRSTQPKQTVPAKTLAKPVAKAGKPGLFDSDDED